MTTTYPDRSRTRGAMVHLTDAYGTDAVVTNATPASDDYALAVRQIGGAPAAGGTSMVDETAFVTGASSVTPVGYFVDEVASDTAPEGSVGVARMSAARVALANLRDTTGALEPVITNTTPGGSDYALVVRIAGAAAGGTSSNFGAAVPSAGTAAGFSDGTNMQLGRVFDADSGAGTQYVAGVNLRQIASGGSVEAGITANPLKIDPTGTTTQPVSGTVAVSSITTAVVPGTAATNLGKAEDAAHSSGDVGVQALTVRQDTAAALAGTDGDYQPPITDASGKLWVNAGGVTLTVASHAVTNAGTFAVQAASAGDVANDGVDSGNPIKVGGVAALLTSPAPVSTAADRVNASFDGQGRQIVRTAAQGLPSDNFKQYHVPAANTQATCVQAAPGAGKRLVVTTLVAGISAGTTAPAAIQLTADLVEDAAGTPSTIWSHTIALPAVAGATTGYVETPVWIEATANKSLTWRFSAAGGANTIESVNMLGVTVTE